jgi:hypothetical protein
VEHAARSVWPELPLRDWQDTYATLHRWLQMVGKTRLALAPMQNHWWQVTLYVTSRGLGTSPMPVAGDRSLEVDFDFLAHRLVAHTSDGEERVLALAARSVADFYGEFTAALNSLGVAPRIYARPVEIADNTPFADDTAHASYDRDAAEHCWRALAHADRVLKAFRGKFIGKSSPAHFFWGSFDLACTRFSGRRAPRHPGGIPNCPDYVAQEAYSHECISAGWWPGSLGSPVEEPAFYAYAYPEPAGCADAPIRPSDASYNMSMREWILPYEAVRQASNPEALVMEFLESTYEVAASRGGWRELDRTRESGGRS